MTHSRIRYLVDNSVWARLPTSVEVVQSLRTLVLQHRPADILVCPPIAAEIGYSARSGEEHDRIIERLEAFAECAEVPRSGDVLDIQNRLWHKGLVRSVGAMDAVIAAYALANHATVLHYDRDFEHVGSVVPEFRHAWVVPRGSL